MSSIRAIRTVTLQQSEVINVQSAESYNNSMLSFVLKCQSQQDVYQLIDTYKECLQSITPVIGLGYYYPLLGINYAVGDTSSPKCKFQLECENEFWGEVTIHAHSEINDTEIKKFELISSLLINPLRSTIYHSSHAFKDDAAALENTQLVEQLVTREAKLSYRENVPMSLVMFDIDRFHTLTDDTNFMNRDKVIYEVMQVMRANVRDTDLLFRYSKDSYCLILKGVSTQDAYSISERVRQAIDMHTFISHENKSQHITVSGGIAELLSTDSIESIFTRTTHAVEHAKKVGRNQSIIADGTFIN